MNNKREECISVIKYLAKSFRYVKNYPTFKKWFNEVFIHLIYQLDWMPPYVFPEYHSVINKDKNGLPVSITVLGPTDEIVETIDLLK